MSNAICQVICNLVHIAPAPRFTGLNRPDDGVMRGVKVLGSVLIFGGVTAADMTAGEANP